MSKEKRYLQWGYDSFKDTKTGEISDNHIHLLNQQDQRISELEQENESYQKLINDICNKHRIGGLKELDEKLGNLEELNVKFIEIGNEYAEKNKKIGRAHV